MCIHVRLPFNKKKYSNYFQEVFHGNSLEPIGAGREETRSLLNEGRATPVGVNSGLHVAPCERNSGAHSWRRENTHRRIPSLEEGDNSRCGVELAFGSSGKIR